MILDADDHRPATRRRTGPLAIVGDNNRYAMATHGGSYHDSAWMDGWSGATASWTRDQSHAEEDGAWQFKPRAPASRLDAVDGDATVGARGAGVVVPPPPKRAAPPITDGDAAMSAEDREDKRLQAIMARDVERKEAAKVKAAATRAENKKREEIKRRVEAELSDKSTPPPVAAGRGRSAVSASGAGRGGRGVGPKCRTSGGRAGRGRGAVSASGAGRGGRGGCGATPFDWKSLVTRDLAALAVTKGAFTSKAYDTSKRRGLPTDVCKKAYAAAAKMWDTVN
jgi:hypothetical protein